MFGGAGDWTIPPLATDIARVVSWNTGMRTNTLSPEVAWSDVNMGPEKIESCQVAVNVEPSYAQLFSWRVDPGGSAPRTAGRSPPGA